MADDKSGTSGTLGVSRLTAFSDGVFAIAITLLVLSIHTPQPDELKGRPLWDALADQWTSYIGFVLSFILVGLIWANHRTLFALIKRSDQTLVIINTIVLLYIAFLPFPTDLLALYLGHGSDQQAAVLLYSGLRVVGAIFFNLIWWYALRAKLADPGADSAELQRLGRRFLFVPLLYAICFALGFVFNGALSLILFAILTILYWLPAVVAPRKSRSVWREQRG